jgi:hypothetical protein
MLGYHPGRAVVARLLVSRRSIAEGERPRWQHAGSDDDVRQLCRVVDLSFAGCIVAVCGAEPGDLVCKLKQLGLPAHANPCCDEPGDAHLQPSS